MAPIKFDKNIKQKLEKRTIQPSNMAWDKLSEHLDVEDTKKNNKNYWWLGIAASVIGVLFVALQFFNNSDSEGIAPEVVDTPEIINHEILVKKDNKGVSPENQEVQQVVVSPQKEESKKTEVPKKQDKIKEPIKSKIAISKELNALAKTIPELENEAAEKDLTFEEQKIQDVVAQLIELKENKKEVTNAEIEALLQQAQQEIALKKIYNENTGIVDANALLEEVEEDLDRSFRIRVFEALKASYGTVKTAVAKRND